VSLRVLLVTHRFPPDGIAGVERGTQALAAELVKMGNSVTILARRPDQSRTTPEVFRERTRDGSIVYRLVGGEIRHDRFHVDHPTLETLFSKAMVEVAPDVVHIRHLAGLPPRVIEIANRHRAAIVVSLSDFYFMCHRFHLQKRSGDICTGPQGGKECARTCFSDEGPASRLRWGLRTAYFRRLLSLAHRVICPSTYVASHFEQFVANPDRIRVVPNGIAIAASAMDAGVAPNANGVLKLACLGSVVAHKGVHVVLEALDLARLQSVDLIVFGQIADTDYANALREQANAIAGVNLRFYGAYRPADLAHVLGAVDCVITPSQVPETFSNTTHEALLMGIPVIAARSGALSEAVLDDVNGITFPHDRPQELASILKRLVRDQSLLPHLRQGARATRITPMAEWAQAVQAVYLEGLTEALSRKCDRRDDADELEFLHRALLDVGFGELMRETADPEAEVAAG